MKTSPFYNQDERLIAEFFTSLMPTYLFFCFENQWCEYFHIGKKDFSGLFFNLIAQTHGAYHKNHDKDV